MLQIYFFVLSQLTYTEVPDTCTAAVSASIISNALYVKGITDMRV